MEELLDRVTTHWFPDILHREYFGDVFNTLTLKNESLEFNVLLMFDESGFETVNCEGLKNGLFLI